MRWLRQHPVATNLVCAFAIALFAGLWANYFTSADEARPMSDRKHLLLALALLLLLAQSWYNLGVSRAERRIVVELLDLGVHFFIAHAKAKVTSQELRVIVHLCERSRPGPKLAPQRCLVPRYWKSPVRPRDFGAIPLDVESFKKWYVNVRAFHEQREVFDQPQANARPAADGHYVSTPSLFAAKSVVSVPIWSRIEPPSIIGTLTFDSVRGLEELNWSTAGTASEAAKDMLNAMADLIGKILSNDEARS